MRKLSYITTSILFLLLFGYLFRDYYINNETFRNNEEELVRVEEKNCNKGISRSGFGFVKFFYRDKLKELDIGYDFCNDISVGDYLVVRYSEKYDYFATKKKSRRVLYVLLGMFILIEFACLRQLYILRNSSKN